MPSDSEGKAPDRAYFVFAPSSYVTGGPEALHQLVDGLRKLGRKAYISYFPANASQDIPEPFAHYDVSVRQPQDLPHEYVIAPESATYLLRRFRRARRAVWWLSVDYFFGVERLSAWADLLRRVRFALQRRNLSRAELRRVDHFCQSRYALDFVHALGLPAQMLSDYVTSDIVSPIHAASRTRRILFNPKKGIATTQRLMRQMPDVEFMALRGLSRFEMSATLQSSMLYMDFGHHPGKDRMPREAAASGCCVITGRRGSAGFQEDLPIPDAYKLDESSDAFEQRFATLVRAIFSRFDDHAGNFDAYRSHIAQERARFMDEIDTSFPRA
ncbi:hypothetical protein [Caldimonas sp. KR1-144]|uniref:hypothetical protein n=1 Tax=Caldimonas sp. KR1-144 TaxID=3400911 RepID=UPI003C06626F